MLHLQCMCPSLSLISVWILETLVFSRGPAAATGGLSLPVKILIGAVIFTVVAAAVVVPSVYFGVIGKQSLSMHIDLCEYKNRILRKRSGHRAPAPTPLISSVSVHLRLPATEVGKKLVLDNTNVNPGE